MNEYNYLAFHLPAFEQVAAFLSPAERFNMALRTDEKVLDRLAASRSKPRNVSFDVTMGTAQKSISFGFEDGRQNFIVLFAEVVNPVFCFTVITSREKSVAQLLRTLGNVQKIFSGSVSRMFVDLGVLDKQALNGLIAVQCEKLTVTGEAKDIPEEEVAEALSNLRATKKYRIESNIGLRIPRLIPTDKLLLKPAHGVSDLGNIPGNTRIVQLLECTLTNEKVNEFLKSWLESTETTIVSMKMTRKDQEIWDLEEVLRGIEHSEYQVDARDRQFITYRSQIGFAERVEEMRSGRDIIRTDGVRGSVRFTDSELFFCIWRDPHEFREKLRELITVRHEAEERKRQCGIRKEQLKQMFTDKANELPRPVMGLEGEEEEVALRRMGQEVDRVVEELLVIQENIRRNNGEDAYFARQVADYMRIQRRLFRFI